MFGKKKEQTFFGVQPTGPVEWLVVGLGNPGTKYDGTRHNIGFEAIDQLADEVGVRIDRLRFQALCGDAMIGEQRALLMKPSTYMNLSGQSVLEAMQFYKVSPERVLVICDDIAQPVGRLRIRREGSDGGHNGLKNIIYLCGSNRFPRIRIGVGAKPHPSYDLADWVLGRFDREEAGILMDLLKIIPDACSLVVMGKIDQAMNLYNNYSISKKAP